MYAMSKNVEDFAGNAAEVVQESEAERLVRERRERIAAARQRVADQMAATRRAAENLEALPFAQNAEEGCTATSVLIHLHNAIGGDAANFMKVRLTLVGSCGKEHWISPFLPKQYKHGIREVSVAEINEVLAEQGYELARRIELTQHNQGIAEVKELPASEMEDAVDEEMDVQAGEESQDTGGLVGEESQEVEDDAGEGSQDESAQEGEDDGEGLEEDVAGEEEVAEPVAEEEMTTPEHSASVESSTEAIGEVPHMSVTDDLFTTYADGTEVGYVSSGSGQTAHVAHQEKMHALCSPNYTTIPQPDKLEKMLAKSGVCQGCLAELVRTKSAAGATLTGKMTRTDMEMVATDELLARAGMSLVQEGQIVDHKAAAQKGTIQGEEVIDGNRHYLISWNGKPVKAQLANMFRLIPEPDWSELRLTALRALAAPQEPVTGEVEVKAGPSDAWIAEAIAEPEDTQDDPEVAGSEEESLQEYGGFRVGEEVIRLGNPSRAEHEPPAAAVIEEILPDGTFVIETWNGRGSIVPVSRLLKPEDLDEWIILNRPEWKVNDATVPGAMNRPEGWRPPIYTRVELVDPDARREFGGGEIIGLPDDDTTAVTVLWDNDDSDEPGTYGLEELRLLPPVPKKTDGGGDAPAYTEGQAPGGGMDAKTDEELKEMLLAALAAQQAPPTPAPAPQPKAPKAEPKTGPAAKLPKKAVNKTGVRTGASTGVDKGNPYTAKVEEYAEGTVAWHIALMDESIGAAGYKNDALGRHMRGPASYIDEMVLEELTARDVAKVVIEQRLDGKNATSTKHNMMLVARLCEHFGYSGNIAGWRGLADSEEFMEELENEEE